jgi:hypothetical protein
MADYTVVSRDLAISAPVAEIAALVVDFHEWLRWSPWEGIDPEMDRSYRGSTSGVGAIYSWSGNRKAGAGQMTITAVEPTGIEIDLDFTRPFKSASKATFGFTSDANVTTVVWQIDTPKTLMTRLFSFVMNLDKVVGPDLEKGLANLKSQVESGR